MNPWLLSAAILMAGALTPALLIGSRAGAVDRLVGLEIAGAVVTVVLLVLSQADQQSSYLIVPLVLVPLSFAGCLVFTRLLGPPR